MAIGVVNLFEIVQVYQDNRERVALPVPIVRFPPLAAAPQTGGCRAPSTDRTWLVVEKPRLGFAARPIRVAIASASDAVCHVRAEREYEKNQRPNSYAEIDTIKRRGSLQSGCSGERDYGGCQSEYDEDRIPP